MALKGGLNTLKEYIDKCIERKLHVEVLDRLLQQTLNYREEFELVISSIFHLGPKYVKLKGYTSFDYQSLIDKIWIYDEKVADKFYKNAHSEYETFLSTLFSAAPNPYIFQNELIYHIKEGNQKIILSKDKLVYFQEMYIKKYVEKSGFTVDGVWLIWATKEHYSKPGPKEGTEYKLWRFEPCIISFLRESLREKDPATFLKEGIFRDTRNKNLVQIYSQVLELFESVDDLRELVENSNYLDSDIRTEFLDFFDRCKEVNFKEFIEFDFKTSLKPDDSMQITDDSFD